MQYKDKNFYLDSKIKPVLGGELHYFRLEKKEWESRIIAMKEAGFNLVSTYIPWMIHEKVENEIDLVGMKNDNHDLVSFIELVKKYDMNLLLRPGPYVMSELVGSGLPYWLWNDYPQIQATGLDLNRHNVKELVCILHPFYLEKVNKWISTLASHIKEYIYPKGPITMIQLDNEVGMFPWVTNNPDVSITIMDKFEQYLKPFLNIYQDVDYEQRVKMLANPQSKEEESLMHYYKLFEREYIKEYLEILQEMFLSSGIDVLNCVNIHGFIQNDYAKRGTLYPIGLSQLSACTSMNNTVLAGDYYIGNLVYENMQDMIIVNALTNSVQNEKQPLFSAEFQSGFQNSIPKLLPSTHDLKARLCFSQGMNAINYYMFCGGYNYDNTGLIGYHHDWQAPISSTGEKRKSYELLAKFNDVIHSYSETYLNSQVDHQATLLYSLDDYLTPYTSSSNVEQTYEIQNDIRTFLFDGIAKFLTYKNISIDANNLNSDRLINSKQAILICTQYMAKDAQEKVVEYLKKGNNLLIYGKLPTKDYLNNECSILLDYLKIKKKEVLPFTHITTQSEPYIASFNDKNYLLDDCEVIAKDCTNNGNVIFKLNVKNSKVAIISSAIDLGFEYNLEIMKDLATWVGIKSKFEVSNELQISSRTLMDTSFINIMNVLDTPITTKLVVNGFDLLDNEMITIAPRSARLLPYNLQICDDILLNVASCEITNIKQELDEVIITFNNPSNEVIYYKINNEPLQSINGSELRSKQ